jgi:iron uptake system component EfeO
MPYPLRSTSLLLVTLACCAASAAAETSKTVEVVIDDKGCQPQELQVPADKITFKIKNKSARAVEWEILKGDLVVEERENILPGFSSSLTAKLDPGSYQTTCGLLSNPRGRLIVAAGEPTKPQDSASDLNEVIAAYRTYVAAQTDELVDRTRVLVDAVKAGQLAKAQKAYPYAHVAYERIEPVAEVFADLDKSMDSRADDYEKKEADPNFSGYHRIEYGLFAKQSTDGLASYADQLMRDALTLRDRVKTLAITPKVLVGGAADLLEEVASKKISGEEDRYSRTDLWDFSGNLDGAQKIVELLRARVAARDPQLIRDIDANFTKVDGGLRKFKTETGFVSFDQVTLDDQRHLRGPITRLAEDLSKLRGTLGID